RLVGRAAKPGDQVEGSHNSRSDKGHEDPHSGYAHLPSRSRCDGCGGNADGSNRGLHGDPTRRGGRDGHLAQIQALVINEKFYESLSPELRAIFDKSAIDAGNYQNQLALKGNKEAL